MQRRQFLQSSLLLGAAGAAPGVTLAASPLASQVSSITPTIAGEVLPTLDATKMFGLLKYATGQHDLELVKFLINRGVDVNAKLESNDNLPLHTRGQSALHSAICGYRSLEIVQYLISQGADVNARDEFGATPLHYACGNSRDDVFECLVSQGADVNAKDKYGNTPLHGAAQRTCGVMMLEYLISQGGDVNAKDEHGNTLLHHAAQFHSCFEVLEYLISQGVDVNAENDDGETALDFALIKEYSDNPDLLERQRKGIDLLERLTGETIT
jgi:ankyrin repeat protein